MAVEVFQMLKDELTEAFVKVTDFPRFLSKLYVKKVLSGPGKNTATVCELMGRKFQVNFVLNLIEGQIGEDHKCLVALIRVLKKDPLLSYHGSTIEGVYSKLAST